MTKVPFNFNSFLAISRRWCSSIATKNVQSNLRGTVATTKVLDSNNDNVGTKAMEEEKKQVYWMRDPKTGNWVPETHFNDINVADLRDKLLSKK